MKTQKLLAEWFWVDRWDGSSAALLPMEAQGLYRAMLSQAWRRGARLPSDLAQVQRAIRCTPDEWARSWPLVSPYWRKEGDFLVNDTQLEIYGQARGMADRARARAQAGAQALHKDRPKQVLEHCPPSPSPSPSPSPTNERTTALTPASQSVVVIAPSKLPWSREACDDWLERFGGTAPGGQIGKALWPLVKKHPWVEVRLAWRNYLAQAEAEYVSPARFAATYGRWSGATQPSPPGERAIIAGARAGLRGK